VVKQAEAAVAVKQAEAAVAKQAEDHRLAAAKAALQQRTAEAERGVREAAESTRQLEDQKRRAEGELLQLSQNLAAQDARLKQLQVEEARRKENAPGVAIWLELADCCVSEQAIKAFFDRRQQPTGGQLRVASAVMVQNETALRAFKGSSKFHIDPLQAWGQVRAGTPCDTLLFHGCSQEAAANIEHDHEGLKLNFARRRWPRWPPRWMAHVQSICHRVPDRTVRTLAARTLAQGLMRYSDPHLRAHPLRRLSPVTHLSNAPSKRTCASVGICDYCEFKTALYPITAIEQV